MTHLLLLLSCLQTPAETTAHAATAFSFEAGSLSAFESGAIQLGLRITPVRTNSAVFDVAVATFPDAITRGVLLFMFDVDVAFATPLGTSEMMLMPRAGLSVLGGAGSGGGGGAAAAYNVGLGMFARMTPAVGFRLDYTHRRFVDGGDSEPFSSVTFGVVLIR